MYLVARPPELAQEMIRLLAEHNIQAEYFPILQMEIKPLLLAELLSLIADCESIFFSSPFAVSCLLANLAVITAGRQVYAPGAGTAKCLSPQGIFAVNYPCHSSGIAALIEECFNQSQVPIKRLALIGGERINPELLAYLNANKIDFKFIDLYQRVNQALTKPDFIAKFINQAAIVGIIITSSLIADYFCGFIRQQKLEQQIANWRLISIHPQISRCLREHGFSNIYESETAENLAVLTLLRKLENE